jgi:hypothetical protein
MLVNFLKRHSAKIKQLGRKPQDRDDVHSIKQEDIIELDDVKYQRDQAKDFHFTNRTNKYRTNLIDCTNLGLERYEDDPTTFKNIPRLHHGLDKVLRGGLFKGNFGIQRIYQP